MFFSALYRFDELSPFQLFFVPMLYRYYPVHGYGGRLRYQAFGTPSFSSCARSSADGTGSFSVICMVPGLFCYKF